MTEVRCQTGCQEAVTSRPEDYDGKPCQHCGTQMRIIGHVPSYLVKRGHPECTR